MTTLTTDRRPPVLTHPIDPIRRSAMLMGNSENTQHVAVALVDKTVWKMIHQAAANIRAYFGIQRGIRGYPPCGGLKFGQEPLLGGWGLRSVPGDRFVQLLFGQSCDFDLHQRECFSIASASGRDRKRPSFTAWLRAAASSAQRASTVGSGKSSSAISCSIKRNFSVAGKRLACSRSVMGFSRAKAFWADHSKAWPACSRVGTQEAAGRRIPPVMAGQPSRIRYSQSLSNSRSEWAEPDHGDPCANPLSGESAARTTTHRKGAQ